MADANLPKKIGSMCYETTYAMPPIFLKQKFLQLKRQSELKIALKMV
jgi:hypothetical protein